MGKEKGYRKLRNVSSNLLPFNVFYFKKLKACHNDNDNFWRVLNGTYLKLSNNKNIIVNLDANFNHHYFKRPQT